MIIQDKLTSIAMIKKLNLNKFPEQLFKEHEEDKIKRFIEQYPAEYYAIRDKYTASGIFKLKVEKEKILDEIKNYKLFTINVSSINYVKHQILVGEIEILANGEVYATLSIDPAFSVRDALKGPTFNLKTDIFDKVLNNIPNFDYLYRYIVDNHLLNVIVEFSLFNTKVGIKNEEIIIYEIRTNY